MVTMMQTHPAAQLFPMLSDDELNALAEDIRVNGQQDPITTYNGMILDGRNRYEACQRAGVEPVMVEWTGEGSPSTWVISKNILRRHLDASQRAVIAVELKDLISAEAKQRQLATLKRGDEKPVPTEVQERGESAEEAAKLVGVSPTYVYQAQRVKREAPEQWEQVIKGETTVSSAHAAIEYEAGREAREEETRKYFEQWDKRREQADRRFDKQWQAAIPADGDALSLANAQKFAKDIRQFHDWAATARMKDPRKVAATLRKLLTDEEVNDLPGYLFESGHWLALIGMELGYKPE